MGGEEGISFKGGGGGTGGGGGCDWVRVDPLHGQLL